MQPIMVNEYMNDHDAGNLFEQHASQMLSRLERVFDACDPDIIEAELAADVLTITVKNKDKIIINRHGAARQIWMAAGRKAWHFDEDVQSGRWRDKKSQEELVSALESMLTQMLQAPFQILR